MLHLDRDEIDVLTRLLGELKGLLGNDDPDVQRHPYRCMDGIDILRHRP